MLDEQGLVCYWNSSAEELFGYSSAETTGRDLTRLIIPKKDRQAHRSGFTKFQETGKGPLLNDIVVVQAQRKDGAEIDIELALSSIMLDGKRHAIGTIREVTDRVREQEKQQEQQSLLVAAQKTANLGIWVSETGHGDPVSSAISWSEELSGILEINPALPDKSFSLFRQRVHPEDLERVDLCHRGNLTGTEPWMIEYRLLMPDGRVKFVTESSQVMSSESSGKNHRIGTMTETTQYKVMEQQLKKNASQQAVMAGLGLFAFRDQDLASILEEILERISHELRVSHGEILELHATGEILTQRAVIGWSSVDGRLRDALTTQAGLTVKLCEPVISDDYQSETRFSGAAALHEKGLRGGASVLINRAGGIWGVLAFHYSDREIFDSEDILFLQAVANIIGELVQSHEYQEQVRLAAATFESHEPTLLTDASGLICRVNQALCRAIEAKADDLIGLSIQSLMADPDEPLAGFTDLVHTDHWTGEAMLGWQELQVPTLIDITRIRNSVGKTTNWLIQGTDLRSLKQKERELQHALKMEAIGQLSGGIAHDFNNLLSIVSGNLAYIRDSVPEDSNLSESFDDALSAIADGAQLNNRLLSFARSTPENLRIMRVSEVIDDLAGFLDRVLGADVELIVAIQDGEKCIEIDPHALESAMLNLAINAKDAMPEGGEIQISTASRYLEPGNSKGYQVPAANNYMMISLSDTGIGITADALQHVLNPFFTTKRAGKGNGLGLSMVKNFAVESGGAVHIESTLGEGTTVSLFFPLVLAAPRQVENEVSDRKPLKGGPETILVVEDEVRLSRTVVRDLENLGYHVLQVENADLAVRVLQADEFIQLVFTDVMMAGEIDGLGLATWIKEHRPDVKVLLTSGHSKVYASQAISGENDFPILRKPYSREVLSENIRSLLDQ